MADLLEENFVIDAIPSAIEAAENLNQISEAEQDKEDVKPRKKQKKPKTAKKTANLSSEPQEIYKYIHKSLLKTHSKGSELTPIELHDFDTNVMIPFEKLEIQSSQNFTEILKKLTKQKKNLIIICLSAHRCLELIKILKEMKIRKNVLKLFSKHLKIAEQEEMIRSCDSFVGVGTSNRILKLFEKNLLKNWFVVFDGRFSDLKERRLFEVDECRKDLYCLVKDYLRNEGVGFM